MSKAALLLILFPVNGLSNFSQDIVFVDGLHLALYSSENMNLVSLCPNISVHVALSKEPQNQRRQNVRHITSRKTSKGLMESAWEIII